MIGVVRVMAPRTTGGSLLGGDSQSQFFIVGGPGMDR